MGVLKFKIPPAPTAPWENRTPGEYENAEFPTTGNVGIKKSQNPNDKKTTGIYKMALKKPGASP